MGKKEGDEIISWIESQPELDYIRVAANKTLCDYRLNETDINERIIVNSREDLSLGKESFFQKIINVFWVPGKNLRGNQLASKELDNSLATTSKVMSVSTIWDFVCTWPIFTYVLGKLAWASGPAGFVLGFIILWASNITGENSTNRTLNNSNKARASLIAFLILSLAKTAVSGVGIDMIISKGRIIEEFAKEEIIKKSSNEQQNIDLALGGEVGDTPETEAYNSAKSECADLLSRMSSLDLSYGKQRKLYREINTSAYEVENAPCKRAAELGIKVSAFKGKEQNKIDIKKQAALKKLKDKTDLSNIAYLLEHYRSVYDTYFYGVPSGYSYKSIVRESDGKEISRDERPIEWKNDRKGDAVEASMKQFFDKFRNGEFAALGFSIFAFIISIILTSTAAILLYTTGKNKEVKASFTSSLGQKSNALMTELRDDIDDNQ